MKNKATERAIKALKVRPWGYWVSETEGYERDEKEDVTKTLLQAIQAEPQQVDLALKHFPNVKPAEDYKVLRKQFGSLITMLSANNEICSVYMKKDYALSEKRLKALEDSLESERAMNAQLTNELESLQTPPEPIDGLDEALSNIKDFNTGDFCELQIDDVRDLSIIRAAAKAHAELTKGKG